MDYNFEQKPQIRISTAPARPLTDIEEFKRSKEFFLLEEAVFSSNSIIQKNYHKLDLDSIDGQKICKKYLGLLERLCEVYYYSIIINTVKGRE